MTPINIIIRLIRYICTPHKCTSCTIQRQVYIHPAYMYLCIHPHSIITDRYHCARVLACEGSPYKFFKLRNLVLFSNRASVASNRVSCDIETGPLLLDGSPPPRDSPHRQLSSFFSGRVLASAPLALFPAFRPFFLFPFRRWSRILTRSWPARVAKSSGESVERFALFSARTAVSRFNRLSFPLSGRFPSRGPPATFFL